ncbi:hypothetical protein ANO11243_042290 [Dothideomycetidae sp. 11243]|nr:hypothetical protein ANO11243_042290 [fungal sp. No.11243]
MRHEFRVSGPDEFGSYTKFCCDRLGGRKLILPMCSANQEARAITLVWLENHDVEHHHGVLINPFDCSEDALFIPLELFEDFGRDHHLGSQRQGGRVQFIQSHSQVISVAVTVEFLEKHAQHFLDSLEYFYSLKTILLIVEAPPALQPLQREASIKLWRYEDLDAGYFLWSPNKSRFELLNAKHSEYYEYYERVGEVLAQFDEPFLRRGFPPETEFRLVLVSEIL